MTASNEARKLLDLIRTRICEVPRERVDPPPPSVPTIARPREPLNEPRNIKFNLEPGGVKGSSASESVLQNQCDAAKTNKRSTHQAATVAVP